MTDFSPLDLMQPHIRRLEMYQGVDPMEVLAEKAGIPLDKVIKLNGNENPYGPSPRVAEALGNFKLYNLYPDPEQRRLRDALSEYLGVGSEHIVAGNGCDEIIDLVLRIFLSPWGEDHRPRSHLQHVLRLRAHLRRRSSDRAPR